MLHSRRAYTLIELLIAIGIIAILVAITVPVVNRSREQAKLATCMSNQRQLYNALQAFCLANTEACPGVCGIIPSGGPGTGSYFGIGQLITTSDDLPQATLEQTCRSVLVMRGYLRDSSVFRCPQQDASRDVQLTATGSTATFHYVFSDFFVGDVPCVPGGVVTSSTTFLAKYSSRFPSFQSSVSPITFRRSLSPTRCVLITEDGMLQDWTQSYLQNQIPYVHAMPWHALRAHKSTDRLPFIMADAAVCTYLDGHAEMIYVTPRDGQVNYTVLSDHAGLPH